MPIAHRRSSIHLRTKYDVGKGNAHAGTGAPSSPAATPSVAATRSHANLLLPLPLTLLFLLPTLFAQAPGPYRIAGTLVSSTDNSPLSRARVTLQDVHTRKEIFLITGDDGRFAFSNIPAGKYA